MKRESVLKDNTKGRSEKSNHKPHIDTRASNEDLSREEIEKIKIAVWAM